MGWRMVLGATCDPKYGIYGGWRVEPAAGDCGPRVGGLDGATVPEYKDLETNTTAVQITLDTILTDHVCCPVFP